MDTLRSITEKINKKTEDSPIFYITNDPERAFGPEKLLENYHIICSDHNQTVEYLIKDKVKVFCIEKAIGLKNTVKRNSNRILNNDFVKKYIDRNSTKGKRNLMVFKIAPSIEKSAYNLGFKILNTSSELNRTFEYKISQYMQFKNWPINFPKTEVLKLKYCDYDLLKEKFGCPFVIQFDRGHTGGGTIFVRNGKILNELVQKFPERIVKVTEFIKGPSFTINACVTRFGIVWGGLSYQITGIAECTTQEGGTVGNDWLFASKYEEPIRSQVYNYTRLIGEKMKAEGFLGLFGVDFILDEKKENIYVIEVNARQSASIPMHSKLLISRDIIPLNLLAISEFLNLEYEIDVLAYNSEVNQTLDAAQLFIRNIEKSKVKIFDTVQTGVYRLMGDNSAFDWSKGNPEMKKGVIMLDEESDKPLVFQKEAYAVDGIKEAGLLVLTAAKGRIVESNYEISRIQALQGLVESEKKLYNWVYALVNGLRKNIITTKEND